MSQSLSLAGVYRADNHAWLFAWKGASVFQAGPSKAMNWFGTTGAGSQTGAGTRAADADSMCGIAAMYDAVAGKILTMGGSPSYQDSDGSSNAHIITLGNPNTTPTVQKIANAAFQRAFHNSVIMPDGKVMIIGGQVHAVPFSDDTAQYTPEMFDPVSHRMREDTMDSWLIALSVLGNQYFHAARTNADSAYLPQHSRSPNRRYSTERWRRTLWGL